MNQGTQLMRLEREILRMEDWMTQRPERVKDEIRNYLRTLKSNYQVITGKSWENYKQSRTDCQTAPDPLNIWRGR